MATKTSGVVGFVAIAAIAALIISVKGKPYKTEIPQKELEDQVTLSVTFQPEQRTEYPVRIEAYMNGVELFPPFMRAKSPWNYTFKAHKGAEILLVAGQMHDGELNCLITHKGVTRHDTTIDGDDPRLVACEMDLPS